jgi:hypothetical protein
MAEDHIARGGWWIVPGVVLGAALWVMIISWMLG